MPTGCSRQRSGGAALVGAAVVALFGWWSMMQSGFVTMAWSWSTTTTLRQWQRRRVARRTHRPIGPPPWRTFERTAFVLVPQQRPTRLLESFAAAATMSRTTFTTARTISASQDPSTEPQRLPQTMGTSDRISNNELLEEYHEDHSSTSASADHNEMTIPPAGDNDQEVDIERLSSTWRDLDICNPVVSFKSWSVGLGAGTGKSSIQAILNARDAQPYLASRLSDPLDHLHVRLKLVHEYQHCNASLSEKLILLHPDTPPLSDLPEPLQTWLVETCRVTEGPIVPIQLHYFQFTASYLLERLLPRSVHPVPTSFETVGHVAHLNLRRPHVPYRFLIGQVLLATLPTIETVIAKVGDVSGPYRTYAMQVLAGRPDTRVSLMERGVTLQFDLAKVYWCSRLSQERQRLLQDEIFKVPATNETSETLVVADVFCGVGALCLQAATMAANATGNSGRSSSLELWVNDWNPAAVEALRENAIRNGVAECFSRISCTDSYDFLMDLGILPDTLLPPTLKPPPPARWPPRSRRTKDITTPVNRVRLPDHVVMNFPLEAPTFLGALRWWPADTGTEPRVHVYTFARADDDDEGTTEGSRTAEEVAVDLIADNLLPQSSMVSRKRMSELNEEYSCKIKVHAVRDVAPGKRVFCVSFSATSKLLRHMRGDFS
jgi:tRNA (guanine37-N1)-methyltransferase